MPCKQKSRQPAALGLRGRGRAPPSPTLWPVATALVPTWPLPPSLFTSPAWQIEFLHAFSFCSFFLNPELERQEKPVLAAAAAILPRKRGTRRAGARGAVPRRSRWPPRAFREPRLPGHAEGPIPTAAKVLTLLRVTRGGSGTRRLCQGGDTAG